MLTITIKKAGRDIDVDESRFADHVREHLFAYGVRQKLNDSVSGLSLNGSASTQQATADEIFAQVQATLDRLYSGDIRAARAAGDTVGKLAAQLAMKKVCNVWLARNKGKELKAYESRAADAAAELAANRDKYVTLAESMIELTSAEDVE